MFNKLVVVCVILLGVCLGLVVGLGVYAHTHPKDSVEFQLPVPIPDHAKVVEDFPESRNAIVTDYFDHSKEWENDLKSKEGLKNVVVVSSPGSKYLYPFLTYWLVYSDQHMSRLTVHATFPDQDIFYPYRPDRLVVNEKHVRLTFAPTIGTFELIVAAVFSIFGVLIAVLHFRKEMKVNPPSAS